MERKRKMPARAAARSEHLNKKRITTPPEKSATPAPEPVPEPVVEEAQLPKSVQAGNPLPTVEIAQADDLSNQDYQSVQESGVLAESLARSRQKWINEGIFEKYWTKPTKRKGVVKEEPNNPPKDSMVKIGTVTITVEPHVLEATMYGVKDAKPAAPTTNSTFRPIMQYGPPNGVMPPPPKPTTPATPTDPAATPSSPSKKTAQSQVQSQPPPQPPPQPATQPQTRAPTPSQAQPTVQTTAPPRPPSAAAQGRPPLASSRGLESVLAPPGVPPGAPQSNPQQGPPAPQVMRSPAPHAGLSHPQLPMNAPTHPGLPTKPSHAPSPTTAIPPSPVTGSTNPPKPPTPNAKPAAPATGTDPIIVTLAERASEDPALRDLMKRVAVGDAAQHELAHFQKIIDQITAEYKRKGGQQGPSADRLLVDGRTVKYFADEVRNILDIVLASNPNQRGSDLKSPPDSDPLVIRLLRKALDDKETRDMIRRIAEGKTKFDDATQLKATLDKLKDLVVKETPRPTSSASGSGQAHTPSASAPNAAGAGTHSRKASVSSTIAAQPTASQALRSKGPPPSLRQDISAIVLEFSGGTGDRYLFPKYSILEYQAGAAEVLASFLIVRKGSKSDYGGDPNMDYYQPVTIRVTSHSGKHLDHLARVVAPQDEVIRYMDDIMDNMTRAEYILLAMRLPRAEPSKEDQGEGGSDTPKSDQVQPNHLQPQRGVLWKPSGTTRLEAQSVGKVLGEDEQYQNFVASVS